MSYQLKTRLETKTPKRILALDGGGIRGALSLGYLAKIEEILRAQHGGNPDFRLCDYFDLIGGTSTGSIIAGALAIGLSVEEIKKSYVQLGATIFGKTRFLGALRGAKFNPVALEKGLQDTFGNIKLGDEDLRTGLCVFAKRVDTQSLWTLNNNPNFPFYEYNKDLPLWEAIRASAAAPTFFDPVKIETRSDGIEAKIKGIFTDGGISPANNPALWLLMMSRTKAYGFNWEAGADQLLLVSVGTGKSKAAFDLNKVEDWTTLNWAQQLPDIMISDFTLYNEILLHLLSESPTRSHYDSVLKDLAGEQLGKEPICTYMRYNMYIEQEKLAQLHEKYEGISESKIKSLVDFTAGKNVEELFEIGQLAAEEEVATDHFEQQFAIK
ncbi:MAG: patatin-like phospholipase family protein [Bacteroidota bacterium]